MPEDGRCGEVQLYVLTNSRQCHKEDGVKMDIRPHPVSH